MSYWICDKDQNCIDCPKYYPEETCEHWIEVEPVKHIHTEADRIRSMTDEELANFMMLFSDYIPEPNRGTPEQCWLNWLKQEAKE